MNIDLTVTITLKSPEDVNAFVDGSIYIEKLGSVISVHNSCLVLPGNYMTNTDSILNLTYDQIKDKLKLELKNTGHLIIIVDIDTLDIHLNRY